MAETTVVTARTPGGQLVALPVLDLDDSTGGGERQVAGGAPSLSGALVAIEDFAAGFRRAVQAVAPRRATVEFSMSFAMQSGRVIALFVDGRAEGSVKVTLEWGADDPDPAGGPPPAGGPTAQHPASGPPARPAGGDPDNTPPVAGGPASAPPVAGGHG
jgi:hypothetical protein